MDSPEAMRLIRRTRQAQDDLRRLFDEVRNFAAPIRLEPTQCSMPSLWRAAWRQLGEETAARDVRLTEQFQTPEEDLPPLVADAFHLTQVFRNLFENALAACPDPVRVWDSSPLLRCDRKGAWCGPTRGRRW